MTTRFIARGKQDGFTLVELLIVAIILAILAAIVVPQFANTAQNAGASALRSNLSSIRSAIELYTQQHNGVFPGAVASTGGACAGGTAGSGALDTQQALTDQLTRYTNAAGQSCSLADVPAGGVVEYPFGPYLKADVIPTNPVSNVATVTVVTTGDLAMGGAGAGGGWRYDTTSGKYIADDTNTDANGIAYDTY